MFQGPLFFNAAGIFRTTELEMTSPGHDPSRTANITCYTLHHDEHGGVDASMTMCPRDGRAQVRNLVTCTRNNTIHAQFYHLEEQVQKLVQVRKSSEEVHGMVHLTKSA